jgi:hypothetical protein
MSGVRSYSFREGDRSEYLAQFLLSALGLCTPIPRQEDIGFDFACSIADQESGLITFGSPYLISIKSISQPFVRVEPNKTTIKENSQQHIAWLFRQGQPIFLGLVDKEAVSLRIYSLLPLWFIYYQSRHLVGSLSLNPRLNPEDMGDVTIPKRGEELPNWPGHFHHDVDLGHPIAIVDLPTIKDEDSTFATKQMLRASVDIAERTLLHQRLLIPHFYWHHKTRPDAETFETAFLFQEIPINAKAREEKMTALAPSLISFALHFKRINDVASLQACATLLKYAPAGIVPDVVLDRVPELRRA